jgi:ATP-dependent DNA helicase RecQ
MQEYVDLEEGHMAFLVESLDGVAEPMIPSTCDPLEIELNEDLVREAVKILNRLDLPIEPRKKWPNGGMPGLDVKGMISEEFRNQVGRALCLWGEAGLGKLVKQGKYLDDRFDEDLVTACTELVNKRNPEVKWVCGIPSLRRPKLVRDFCQRLASKLQIPYLPALICVEQRPEQKEMQNSVQQARNVDGAMAIDSSLVFPEGPVLLVDDMVDSRWTLTVAGWLLKQAGVEDVYPMALARTGEGS